MWNEAQFGRKKNKKWVLENQHENTGTTFTTLLDFQKYYPTTQSYIHTSSGWYLPLATFNQPLLGINHDLYNGLFYPPTKSSYSIESLTQFIGVLVRSSCSAEIRRSETAEKQGQEQIQNLQKWNENTWWRSQFWTYVRIAKRGISLRSKCFWQRLVLAESKEYVWQWL